MKRVLLTGATGFIGRHAIRPLLERGFEVHAIARRTPSPIRNTDGLIWHSADLFDAAQTRALAHAIKPTHLLHFAWYVAHGKFWTAAENLDWVAASVTLLRTFAEAGGSRVVMAGTCAEYDWTGDGVCRENVTLLNPATLYGECKRALGIILLAFAKQRPLSAAWGRIFFPYGPHEPPQKLVPSMIRALLRGEPALASNGLQARDFLHTQDVASAFTALLDSTVEGAVNIGSGQPTAVREVALRIGDQLGRPELVRLGALPASPKEPPMLVADVTRLRDEVGWRPNYDLTSGLADSIAWWKQNL